MTTATRTHRTAALSAEQHRARQDELLATLADGVLELTTSDGWRRYLRAMTTLRTHSSGNSCILQPRECCLTQGRARPAAGLAATASAGGISSVLMVFGYTGPRE